jgi:hypothetical protein
MGGAPRQIVRDKQAAKRVARISQFVR